MNAALHVQILLNFFFFNDSNWNWKDTIQREILTLSHTKLILKEENSNENFIPKILSLKYL